MEQGLGKTRTALELIKLRLDKGKVDKILWLCPCSVKSTIEDDFKKHLENGIELIRIEGIESLSTSIRLNNELLDMVKNNNVYLIVDESNLVKNFYAMRTKNIARLAEYCKYKLILNGTPISQSEKDLFAQWYILDWRILGYQSFWSFAANHLEYDENIPGKIRRCLNTDYLVKKIAPYTYQVTKEELIKEGLLYIPKKIYFKEYYDLTDMQNYEYERVKDIFLSNVNEFEPSTIYRLFTALQHVISGNWITSKIHEKIKIRPMFSNVNMNPRIVALMDLVRTCEDEKILIWCKYTSEIKNVSKVLREAYGYNSVVEFYGEIKKKQRFENIRKFSDNAKFFVGNKTCAGYGLNLQFANNSIYYSNDWDYATRSQSEDRLHRIGQKTEVNIMDICAINKLDERILSCLQRKESLVDSFKKEISLQKDKEYLDIWLSGKTMYGKKYTKKCKINDYEDLKEEVN